MPSTMPGMKGTNAKTGKALDGIDHLRQSVTDILTTPIGSRVMRREYGSKLPRLVDAPITRPFLLELYAATAEALARWEPRFTLGTVKASSAQPGLVVLDLTGDFLLDGQTITIEGVVIQSGRTIGAGSSNLISQQVIINELAVVAGA